MTPVLVRGTSRLRPRRSVYGTIYLYCLQHGRFLAWAAREESFDGKTDRIVNETLTRQDIVLTQHGMWVP